MNNAKMNSIVLHAWSIISLWFLFPLSAAVYLRLSSLSCFSLCRPICLSVCLCMSLSDGGPSCCEWALVMYIYRNNIDDRYIKDRTLVLCDFIYFSLDIWKRALIAREWYASTSVKRSKGRAVCFSVLVFFLARTSISAVREGFQQYGLVHIRRLSSSQMRLASTQSQTSVHVQFFQK